jgi:hypothetical protein
VPLKLLEENKSKFEGKRIAIERPMPKFLEFAQQPFLEA